MEKKKYYRLKYPDYQVLMDEHSSEWPTEIGIIGEDVLVPKSWVDDYEKSILKEKKKLIKVELKALFEGTYIKKFDIEIDRWWGDESFFTIHSRKPVFDEDYGGEFDRDIEKIGKKHGVHLGFSLDSYGK